MNSQSQPDLRDRGIRTSRVSGPPKQPKAITRWEKDCGLSEPSGKVGGDFGENHQRHPYWSWGKYGFLFSGSRGVGPRTADTCFPERHRCNKGLDRDYHRARLGGVVILHYSISWVALALHFVSAAPWAADTKWSGHGRGRRL